jgi:site-specific recombinase XerD
MDQAHHRFEQYIEHRYGQSTTPRSHTSDRDIFPGTTGDKQPEAIAALDVDVFIDSQLADGMSPITLNRRLATVYTFFEYLASECPDRPWPNPVIGRRHKVKRGSLLPRDAPDDEVTQLASGITAERGRAMFGIMLAACRRHSSIGQISPMRYEAEYALAA